MVRLFNSFAHSARRAFVAGGASAAIAVVLAVASPAVAEGQVEAETEEELTKGEQRLAKLIEGRVAGEPVRCIRTLPNQRMQVIDKTAYVYGSGNTIYVQRTQNPEDIDRHDVLVTRRFSGSQLCRLDLVTTVDRFVGFFTGAVFFDDFIPYTRVDEADRAKG